MSTTKVSVELGSQELVLKSPENPNPKDGKNDDLQYDPHLQEEVLRWTYDKDLTKGVCTRQGLVDVIAKLYMKDGQATVPPQIQDLHVIGQLDQFQIVTGAVAPQDIRTVRDQVESLKAGLPVHLHLFNSVPAVRCDPGSLNASARDNGDKFPGLDGSDVIIGIVDSGCDFRHQNFRHSTGATRILSLWDQSTENDVPPPQGFSYGREFTAETIDKALAAGDVNAYKVLDYTPAIAAHGTHVMDIAAGNGQEPALFNGKPGNGPIQSSVPGVAPNADIIFVNLRNPEKVFLGNSRGLLDAVAYIFEKADHLGKPAVVNLSLSTTGGPHDGTTLVEQGFEALVNATAGRAIVTSAGNSYTMRSHLHGKVAKSLEKKILWDTDPRHTDPDNGIKNEIEIWYPKGKKLKINLYDPRGKDKEILVESVALGETKVLFAGGQRVGRISHREKDPNNEDNHIDIRLPHFADDDLKDIPWKIGLSSEDDEVEFHTWIEQSERGLSRLEGQVGAKVTLGSISCSNGTVTVGAFDTAERAALSLPYAATSAGPIRKTAINAGKTLRKKPELSAPGVNIVAARAQGGVTALSGTSMAAPHVTGLIALLFQLAHRSGRGLLPFTKTCDILEKSAQFVQSPQNGEPACRSEISPTQAQSSDKLPHDPRLGFGRINGSLAVTQLLRSILTSLILDIKLLPGNPSPRFNTFEDLFQFLKQYTIVSSHNGDTDAGILNFISNLIKDHNMFRITIEFLS